MSEPLSDYTLENWKSMGGQAAVGAAEIRTLRAANAALVASNERLRAACEGCLRYMKSKMPNNWQHNTIAQTALAALGVPLTEKDR